MRLPFTFTLFFFNDTATTEIYTLSLHDALPIFRTSESVNGPTRAPNVVPVSMVIGKRYSCSRTLCVAVSRRTRVTCNRAESRSEEHTSELQSRPHLVCRLLLEKKKKACSVSKEP